MQHELPDLPVSIQTLNSYLEFSHFHPTGLFVGMKITDDVINYLKRRHEEDMVCLHSGI